MGIASGAVPSGLSLVLYNPSGTPAGLHTKCTAAHGVQSVGITTNFNLEQAFELGQIQIYENIEGLPDVEVTLEKVLDGYPLLYHLATPNPESVGLVGRGKARADVALGIYSDGVDSVTDSGNIHYGGGAEGGFSGRSFLLWYVYGFHQLYCPRGRKCN